MTSFGLLRVDTARQLGTQRVSASGPAGKPSLLLSPRCHPAAHTSTPAAAYRADRVATAEPAVPQHSSAVQRRSSGFDDSYDSAVPMAALPGWERVEEDLGLGPEELGSDPQEWEEMVSLLSFDGEEHKRVTRQMHGANARVEDMFASFDGDDFEAVMRATRGEVPNEGAQPTDSPPQQTQAAAPGSSSSSSTTSLYQAVCALRAAAQAAEVAKKRCPALKKRRTPLGDSASNDAWMLQVPHAVAVQQQQQPGGAAAQGCGASGGAGGPQQHSKPGSSLPARVQMAYVGVSCDSSSDGSCDASQDEQQAAAAQPAAAQHMAAAVGSNNIVSSRALATKLAPAAAAVVEAAAPARSMAKGAAATAVLEAVPVAVAVAAAAPTAVAPASQLVPKDVAQQTASQQILEGAAHVAKGRGWSSSSTKGLRRALARLHHTLPRE